MKIISNLVCFILLNFIIYVLCMLSVKFNIYDNIKKRLLKNNNQYDGNIKSNKILYKLYIIIISSGIIDNSFFWWITPQTIIVMCVVFFISSYLIFIGIIQSVFLSIIFCIPISISPIFVLLILSDINEEKMEKNLISYIIQLKNQAKISNDVIGLFTRTVKYTQRPLNTYIKIFLFEINNGVSTMMAFENLKEKVKREKFKQLIINLESCYINGGDLYILLDKTQNVIMKINDERIKRNEQTASVRLVLIILIAISLFAYFKFVVGNKENFEIMMNGMTGKLIIMFNFLCVLVMMFLIIYVKKMEE